MESTEQQKTGEQQAKKEGGWAQKMSPKQEMVKTLPATTNWMEERDARKPAPICNSRSQGTANTEKKAKPQRQTKARRDDRKDDATGQAETTRRQAEDKGRNR